VLDTLPEKIKELLQIDEMTGNLYLLDGQAVTGSPQPHPQHYSVRPTLLNLTLPNLTKLNSTLPNADLEKSKPRQPKKIPTEKIDELLEFWQTTVGFKVSNETGNRRALASLLRQHTEHEIQRMVLGVHLSIDDQYAPRISDFVSLKRKWNDLVIWGRKRSQSGVEVIS
jgi:hypothetical protein